MYCTVNLQLYTRNDVSKYLTNVKESFNQYTGDIYYSKGNLKNLEFERRNNMLFLKNGSLSTYYFGNNFETLSVYQAKEVIESLGDNLHLDFNQAESTRIDFASNILTNEPPQNYFNCLIEINKLNRNRRNSTLYFSNEQRKLVFYDKVKEYQNKKKSIPVQFIKENVLRYERRIYHIKKLKFTGKDLYNPNYFNKFLADWRNDYYCIKKFSPLKFTKEINKKVNMKSIDLFRWKLFIDKVGGIEKLNDLLDNEQRRGVLPRQNKYYMKKIINEAVNSPDLLQTNNLVYELNEKIDEVFNKFIS
jgi:hypothetical protein